MWTWKKENRMPATAESAREFANGLAFQAIILDSGPETMRSQNILAGDSPG
jgi:hypothetical protein